MTPKLVYDIGAHNGDDTAYYLKSGYRVLAIEADPTLAATLVKRFQGAPLEVLNVGIAEEDGQLPFYICPSATDWNSFDEDWAKERGLATQKVMIPTRTSSSVMREYGVPYFMKVDIEGYDAICIAGLDRERRPQFVSFEANVGDIEAALYLHQIGYTRFALVNQYTFADVKVPAVGTPAHALWACKQMARQWVRRYGIKLPKHKQQWAKREGFTPGSSSGPTPMERKSWMSFDDFAYTWRSVVDSGILTSAWFDIHAAL